MRRRLGVSKNLSGKLATASPSYGGLESWNARNLTTMEL
jgi:hypothetical protein